MIFKKICSDYRRIDIALNTDLTVRYPYAPDPEIEYRRLMPNRHNRRRVMRYNQLALSDRLRCQFGSILPIGRQRSHIQIHIQTRKMCLTIYGNRNIECTVG